VVDERGDRDADVLVGDDGRISAVGAGIDVPAAAQVLDAGGCVVAPGLVDIHTHLRQPGREEAETIESGSRAAALGGYTCVLAMPNTEPAIDHAGIVREVQALAQAALCDVAVAGAITVGRAGEQLAPLGEMAALGVRIFTDDGNGVQDVRLMRRALEYASGLGVTLAEHCEDDGLAAGGHMHEGAWSSKLGIPGVPAEAEELMVLRDIALARLTGARVHLQHLSTGRSVALVREAKAAGVDVTCEATTHHFTLTDECCATYDPVFKVNPPLRTADDVDAVVAGLRDGTIDCIATDHAPHSQEAKETTFDDAPPGMLGLETALSLALDALDLPRALALLSWRPAAILGATDHGGPVEPGRLANLCVVDPSATWTVEPERLASRSRNTPYAGRAMTGRARHTILRGEAVVVDGSAIR
jgi:dihydroorotase